MSEIDPASPERLKRLVASAWVSSAIYAVAKLDLAERFAGGARSVDEVASAARLDAPALYRVLRALADAGVFVETSPRCFALTATGEALRGSAPGSLRQAAILLGEAPSGDLLERLVSGSPSVDRHPEAEPVLRAAMRELSADVAQDVVRAYDFSGLARVVDVGGDGTLAAAIRAACPATEVVAVAVDAAWPEADALLLDRVLHAGDDARAAAILDRCRAGRLVLVERVIPRGAEPFFGRVSDLFLLVLAGGRERDEAEYSRLLEAQGFEMFQVIPTRSGFHVIEAVRSCPTS